MFISKLIPSSTVLQPIDSNIHDPLIKIIATVVPILNGRDSDGNTIYLGPQTTKIPRYLLVIFMARSSEVFRLGYGKQMDGSIYFTLYGLGKVADSFKQFGPYHQPIHYDRTKAASKVYTMISNENLVAMKKIDGETYVKITEKGDERSNKLLQEFIAYREIADMNRKTDSEERFVAKGGMGYDPELQRVQKRLAEKISEINLPFEDELRTIEEDD
jgi:hypothetical protein